MNFSSVLGVVIAGAVLFFGVFHHAKNPAIFFDSHALILVVGGTLAATFSAFSFQQIMKLVDFLVYGVVLKKKTDPLFVLHDLRVVANKYYNQKDKLEKFKSRHPMVNDGINLLLDEELSTTDVESALSANKEAFMLRYREDASVLNSIAKYPPAFGLLGASTGMIAMMTNLGGEGGTSAIGAAMAVALVATFWGIAMANFILLPLADYAHQVFLKDQELRKMIIQGIIMIKEKTPDHVIAERLKNNLNINERARVVSFRKGQNFVFPDDASPHGHNKVG